MAPAPCHAIRPAHCDIVELSEIHHLLVPEPRYFPFDQSARAHCGIESQVGVWIAWTIIDEIQFVAGRFAVAADDHDQMSTVMSWWRRRWLQASTLLAASN